MVKSTSIKEIRKKVTTTYELISTAYHEAGHTIYALLSQMKVEYVQIFEHKTLKRIHGFTQYESFDLDKDNVFFDTFLEREIGLSYAGWLAEKHHFQSISGSESIPMFIREGSSDDLLAVRKTLAKYDDVIPPGKKRNSYKRKIIKKTTAMLLAHWDAVDLVSHSLFKYKKLSFIDLQNLLIKKSKDKKFWREQFKSINQIFKN